MIDILINRRLIFCIEIHDSPAFWTNFPCLIVCPRIVIRQITFKRIIRCDKHVDSAFRCELLPPYVCNLLCTKRFLRLRFINFTISLDMQIIFHVRRESVNPAGIIITVCLSPIFRAVSTKHCDDSPQYHMRCIGI